jgi:autotransporter-associated beta strand protein
MKGFPSALVATLALVCPLALRAEFLYAPGNPTPNGFITPTLDFESMVYEYSAWDIFYAPHTVGNFPDVFAPYGGVEASPGVWVPESRTSAGFANNPLYNPSNALAFWDTRNPTLTQLATSAFIIGPDITGNIYTFSEKTSYVLRNDPDYNQAGAVILQLQTDGSSVDFAGIKLVYSDGSNMHTISALDAEYLREYRTTGGTHWSAAGGYANRVAIQWDMSGITDGFGNPITAYEIQFAAAATSMSLQKVELTTSDTYQAGIPISAAWTGGNGAWSTNANWTLNASSGLAAPQQNGNIKFQNAAPIAVSLDQIFSIGELIFEALGNVRISTANGSSLTANTGLATRATATGVYTIDPNWAFGALNFFEIKGGTVVMNGVVSGNYGMVKSGAGALLLNNNNTFTGFVGVQDGTLRLGGRNTYTGGTTVINGRLIVAADASVTGALGNSTGPIAIGADQSLYQFVGAGNGAELLIEGNHTISRDVVLAAGDNSKRLGTFNAPNGGTFSGTIFFTGTPADPNATSGAAGNVKLTAQNPFDILIFSGPMSGGDANKTVTLDGVGTVVFSGISKTYANATKVASGTLEIASGVALDGNGALTVEDGARLAIHGSLSGTGPLTLNGGTLGGVGTVNRTFALDLGDTLAPGAPIGVLNTVAQAWGNGGRFQLEFADADSTAGLGWDSVSLTGTLNLSATNGGFTLELRTLGPTGDTGLMQDFDPAQNYQWRFAGTTGGILNFAASDFTIDVLGFQNSLNGGSFFVTQSGSELLLNFQAVPEPSTALLFAGGVLLIVRRRRV